MYLEFPIEQIKFDFAIAGTGSIKVKLNDRFIEGHTIEGSDLTVNNTLSLYFTKNDASDSSSFATLDGFHINGGDFRDQIKSILYKVDNTKHPDAPLQIQNNLYFGYIGCLTLQIDQTDSLLAKAAWIIADKEFEYIKWPLRGNNYRTKDFATIQRDAKYMFTGSLAPDTQEINHIIDNTAIGDLRRPLDTGNDRGKIQRWINRSKRINLKRFESLQHFTVSQGIMDSLNSFITSTDVLYMPGKMYYFHGEVLQDKKTIIKDVFNDSIDEGSNVLFELPSPWYPTEEIINKVKEAKDKNCRIALDLTWLPATNEPIELDLDMVDQIFFSMNKTWPIHDLRPAFRWSRQRINDAQTFQYDYCFYPKVAANMFMKLIGQVELDFVFDKYKNSADEIRNTFDLSPTTVLWFTKHQEVDHDKNLYISPYYFLDEFVCIRKLLDFKGKYFW